MRFALIAGEISGDILGAAIIRALKITFPQAKFYGVAGPRMIEAGCEGIASIEALSVMGLAEVLPAIPRLLRLRAQLLARFIAEKPDCVIGIDAPDFNLGLEKRLKWRGIRTVHVVSPTVWAWRQGRVKTIAKSVDLMLCLFPFEPKFYAGHGVPAEYIGHPLADELDDSVSQAQAHTRLGMPAQTRCVAILPGSRAGELKYLAEPFAQTAAWLHARRPELRFITPIAKPGLRAVMQQAIDRHAAQVPWTLLEGQSRAAMQAAEVVLLASGTATLECLLLGRPMVVAYRASAFTAWLMLRLALLKTKHVSLPNILAAQPTVAEMLQDEAGADRLGPQVLRLLDDAAACRCQLEQFSAVRAELRRDGAGLAARAIRKLLYPAVSAD
jgi:lipid-A-disaccharide synthase